MSKNSRKFNKFLQKKPKNLSKSGKSKILRNPQKSKTPFKKSLNVFDLAKQT